MKQGRNVLGLELEGAFVRLPFELEFADDPVDEAEVVGPAEVGGIEALGVRE